MPNELEGISNAIKLAALNREEARKQAEKERGEPDLFVPDEDPDMAAIGHGVGFWMCRGAEEKILAIRKMSNGYELHPFMVYDVSFLRRLVQVYDGS